MRGFYLLALAVAVVAVSFFSSSGHTQAHLDTDAPDLSFCEYATGAGIEACPNQVGDPVDVNRNDPINLLFAGVDSPLSLVPYFQAYLGWEVKDCPLSNLYFIDHGRNQGPEDLELGSSGGCFDLTVEDHIRLKDGRDENRDEQGAYVLGAVHRDRLGFGGHVGDDFDDVRREIAEAFASRGHIVQETEIDNTLATHQFLATNTSSLDGKLAVIWVNRPEGPEAILPLPGCVGNILPANDDGSTGAIALPFTLNFYGNTYGALFVNNNGNVTFDAPMRTYTPFGLASTNRVIIAPFFADVDTRVGNVVTYGNTTYGGRTAFCVNSVDVGYYSHHTEKLNSFQLLLVDRSDVNPGDFDIIMNYDKVQWETGDASGGSGGLGGSVARMGYSNGSTASFELPGSAVSLYFLDSSPTGLIHNSRDSLQDGRYIFPVRSGGAPTGGTISGNVYANSINPANALEGAFVQVCGTAGSCNTTTTNSLGEYVVGGLSDGQYDARAFPPGSSSLLPDTIGPLTVSGGGTLSGQDIVLTGPTPPPPGTTITSPHTTTPDGVPIVIRGQPVDFQTTGCSGGTATYEVLDAATVIHTGAMTEGPPGTYSATIPGLRPASGDVEVRVTIDCPGSIPDETVDFDIIYIDPSGTVRTVGGSPIAGATVTLLRSDSSSGPFEVVPDGSGIMSLANRDNPDTTNSVGHFGWDVIAGYYIVRAQMDGCVSPADPGQAFVESAVLTIPPPVTDLDLRLDCGAVEDSTPPSTTISLDPAVPDGANGWYVSPVTATLTAEDDPGGSGVSTTEYRLDGGSWQPYVAPFTLSTDSTTAVDARSTDNAGNVEDPPASATVQIDQTAPTVDIEVPSEGIAVQDGVTLAASANDATSGLTDVRLYVREDDSGSGIPVGYEGLAATYNSATGHWEYSFDSTALPDGYYVALAKAEDNAGNVGWSDIRHFSIRNWAVLELLPASESNKAGRTMPVKFSLRIAAAVDPAQPFVYNEDLTIKIYEAGHPGNVLQTSMYGDGARNYRIDTAREKYITNFKTLKRPQEYTVEIWRHNTLDFLVGDFSFSTVK